MARGDSHALELIYERHSRGVYSLAVKLLSDGPAAEEVVQETFLKLWRQPSAYQSNRGRLLPWLLGVAHHNAVDLLRRCVLDLVPAGHGLRAEDGVARRAAAAASPSPALRFLLAWKLKVPASPIAPRLPRHRPQATSFP